MDPSTNDRMGEWLQARAWVGEGALEFLLDLDSGETPEVTDEARWEVIGELARLQFNETHLQPEQQLSLRAHMLTRVLHPGKATFLEDVRRHVSGRLPELTGDQLVDNIARLVFNGMLIDLLDGGSSDRFLVSAAFQDPALYDPVAESILKDRDLASLFPQREPSPDTLRPDNAFGLLLWSPLGGGTCDLRIVVGAVVEQTLARMRFAGALHESQITAFVQETLHQLRSFAKGEELQIIGMSGLLHIEIDGQIDRGDWGIRDANGLAISDIPGAPAKPKSIIWQKMPVRLVRRARNDLKEGEVNEFFRAWGEENDSAMRQTHRTFDIIRYGLAAWGVKHEVQINVTSTAPWDLFPMKSTSFPFVTSNAQHPSPVRLTQPDLEEVATIVDGASAGNPSMDIALRRILRVHSEQRDPVDALVDSVIAWENMLGSSSETTFKVCAALAWLLEPDRPSQRSEVYGRCSRIYNLRSRLVHGDADTDEGTAGQHVKDAIRIAVEAFGLIHADSTLRVIKKSSSRSQSIIMGTNSR